MAKVIIEERCKAFMECLSISESEVRECLSDEIPHLDFKGANSRTLVRETAAGRRLEIGISYADWTDEITVHSVTNPAADMPLIW